MERCLTWGCCREAGLRPRQVLQRSMPAPTPSTQRDLHAQRFVRGPDREGCVPRGSRRGSRGHFRRSVRGANAPVARNARRRPLTALACSMVEPVRGACRHVLEVRSPCSTNSHRQRNIAAIRPSGRQWLEAQMAPDACVAPRVAAAVVPLLSAIGARRRLGDEIRSAAFGSARTLRGGSSPRTRRHQGRGELSPRCLTPEICRAVYLSLIHI